MIVKDITLKNTYSPTAKAGQKQEQDVAFFLRRAFKDNPHIFVINDFKFTYNAETAQIDHLLVYPYGFILIESKSIKGEVKVNSFNEWTRSFNSKWVGMPSPIKQVELQQRLLRELLFENRGNILDKILGLKQSFGMRCWDNVCVVSSDAIIDRETMPKEISKQLVKSEFLVEKLNKIMKLSNVVMRTLNILDTRPKFNLDDLKSIIEFLVEQIHEKQPQILPIIDKVLDAKFDGIVVKRSLLKCKNCGESSDFTAKSGRYGYYIKCNKCIANTAMKMPCVICQSKSTNVLKRGNAYLLLCEDCENAERLL
ncbi:NERD domain-containing protein [Psychromonas sp. CNPT3]|uniref:nuclease-related domain-containing protein n=1 Tax=Psychromonas sp. CNPT3 TaxID=314282 RepID=UPI00006E70DC|nr:nuclease-related domain-containing protein [Psychromonas sp. CNPT3]AGH81455.1 NERD domain-containing protein [Psychromonas sp. CNPT3]